MSTSLARRERDALCDLALLLGPDAPTLCEGWDARDLVTHLGPLLDDIYAHCEGYRPAADKVAYLTGIRKKEAAVYHGAPGRTVQTIAQEKALRARLTQLVEARTWDGMSASAMRAAIRRRCSISGSFAIAPSGRRRSVERCFASRSARRPSSCR